MQEDLLFKLALREVDGVGGVLFRHLISFFGSAKKVIEAPVGALTKVPGVGKNLARGIASAHENLKAAEILIEKSARLQHKILTFQDADYPSRFKGIYDAPPILFYTGKPILSNTKTIGIVGTRKATAYGKRMTEDLVQGLSASEVSIISGLAYGIDIAAHKAALKAHLPTLAVMAGGLDFVYPAVHRKYTSEIVENGALLSENKLGTVPVGPQFIARNRIIAALSDVVVVVESAKRGGGLVTAEYANNYHRDVYAFPGNLGEPFSEGTNALIAQNKAKIFTGVDDFLNDMLWDKNDESLQVHTRSLDLSLFSEDESKVLALLREKGECLIDDISFDANIPLNKLASLLLNLEFQEVVKAMPGKKFALKMNFN
ncbi:DNA-processing protein DprA [Marinilongibacter aquaticus]|uniref:DNA-processing protein DprA n=1 Tax=Marinilongibacter aquaticus TaxID=2975157 RepID=UPI0021BD5DBB|nr:DNA-processing protein DprA [Marinilongibacter aquaticus]UBM59854.1 DNA-processing protein DprA [Marinilongibacter aquaticus]